MNGETVMVEPEVHLKEFSFSLPQRPNRLRCPGPTAQHKTTKRTEISGRCDLAFTHGGVVTWEKKKGVESAWFCSFKLGGITQLICVRTSKKN